MTVQKRAHQPAATLTTRGADRRFWWCRPAGRAAGSGRNGRSRSFRARAAWPCYWGGCSSARAVSSCFGLPDAVAEPRGAWDRMRRCGGWSHRRRCPARRRRFWRRSDPCPGTGRTGPECVRGVPRCHDQQQHRTLVGDDVLNHRFTRKFVAPLGGVAVGGHQRACACVDFLHLRQIAHGGVAETAACRLVCSVRLNAASSQHARATDVQRPTIN